MRTVLLSVSYSCFPASPCRFGGGKANRRCAPVSRPLGEWLWTNSRIATRTTREGWLAKLTTFLCSLCRASVPDDRKDFRNGGAFRQEAISTVLRCGVAVDLPIDDRQHDDLRRREPGFDAPGRLWAVQWRVGIYRARQ